MTVSVMLQNERAADCDCVQGLPTGACFSSQQWYHP